MASYLNDEQNASFQIQTQAQTQELNQKSNCAQNQAYIFQAPHQTRQQGSGINFNKTKKYTAPVEEITCNQNADLVKGLNLCIKCSQCSLEKRNGAQFPFFVNLPIGDDVWNVPKLLQHAICPNCKCNARNRPRGDKTIITQMIFYDCQWSFRYQIQGTQKQEILQGKTEPFQYQLNLSGNDKKVRYQYIQIICKELK